MDTIIDINKPLIFCREEWIFQQKTYSQKDLPLFIINACDEAFTMPLNEMSRFPAYNIAIIKLPFDQSLNSVCVSEVHTTKSKLAMTDVTSSWACVSGLHS